MNVPVRKNYVQFLKICWMLIQQVNWARIISSLLNTRMVKNLNTLLPNIRVHILPADMENLELLWLVIISFILTTLLFDSGVIL